MLAVWPSFALGQERPEQYLHSARIGGAGEDSHYRFTLPAEAYRGVTRADLGDLRVFNGAGELVPYAFVPHRPATQKPALRATKLFPLQGEPAKGMDGLNVRIRHTAGGGTSVDVSTAAGAGERKLLGYILDPGDLKKAPLEALILDWQTRDGFTGSARVEASEDLKSWITLASGASILHLQHAGQRLERRRVELGGQRARYLRVSFTGVPLDFTLKAATLELRPDKAEPAREWLALTGTPDAKKPGEYAFDTGGHFPVDRLRFALPQQNSVAQGQVLTRDKTEEPWRPATSGTVYRLRRNSEEVTNADLTVAPNASRYWLLKVDQRGGGLGGGEVGLEIGWVPHQVVFAARGAAPFTLAYGMKIAKPGALPIAAVLPDYKEGEAIALKTASLTALASPGPQAASGFSAYLREAVDSGQAKKWALWGSLVLGVLLLVWMAFALLKQVGKPKQ
ncbi:MAG: DUF3999 domain-containing protein [Betaproteobacteria bacterium]